MAMMGAIAAATAFSGFGGRLAEFLPLWALVGAQAFRLPLELAMDAMYARGVMPVELSYSGRNFDILTGITYPPFVWLPAVMVLAALVGHLLIFRKLWRQQKGARAKKPGRLNDEERDVRMVSPD
jgi:hypothetical protein